MTLQRTVAILDQRVDLVMKAPTPTVTVAAVAPMSESVLQEKKTQIRWRIQAKHSFLRENFLQLLFLSNNSVDHESSLFMSNNWDT